MGQSDQVRHDDPIVQLADDRRKVRDPVERQQGVTDRQAQ